MFRNVFHITMEFNVLVDETRISDKDALLILHNFRS